MAAIESPGEAYRQWRSQRGQKPRQRHHQARLAFGDVQIASDLRQQAHGQEFCCHQCKRADGYCSNR